MTMNIYKLLPSVKKQDGKNQICQIIAFQPIFQKQVNGVKTSKVLKKERTEYDPYESHGS